MTKITFEDRGRVFRHHTVNAVYRFVLVGRNDQKEWIWNGFPYIPGKESVLISPRLWFKPVTSAGMEEMLRLGVVSWEAEVVEGE